MTGVNGERWRLAPETERRWAGEYTSEEIQLGISDALKAHDMPAVVGLLHLLAVVDPHAAAFLLDVIRLLPGAAS